MTNETPPVRPHGDPLLPEVLEHLPEHPSTTAERPDPSKPRGPAPSQERPAEEDSQR